MKKAILSWVIGILVLFSFSMSVKAEENVIMISTPEQLDAVRENLNGNYQLANDLDMTGYYDMKPIGNETEGAFTGTFDGNGYVIKNLELDYDFYKYVGLFGYLNGTVQNVKLENAKITGARYTGGIAAYAGKDSLITDCEVSGTIKGGSEFFESYVAGMAGVSLGTITDCINAADLSTTDYMKAVYTAGITNGRAILIENCTNKATINNFAKDSTGQILGIGKAVSIENCINEGSLDYENYQKDIYGIGYADAIKNCSNLGNIGWKYENNITASSVYGIGRINNTNGSIENCVNKGNLRGSGVVYGIGERNIENCINFGELTQPEQYDMRSVYGIGRSNIRNSVNAGNLRNQSYNGDIYGIGYDNIQNCINSGNLLGYGRHCDVYGIGDNNIKNCLNTGDLISDGYSYEDGTVYAIAASGGVSNSISYGSQNQIRVVSNGSANSYSFDRLQERGGLETIIDSKELAELDYEEIYHHDENWNSGLPVLQGLPSHLELNEIYLFLYSGESAQLKGRIDGVEVTDIEYSDYNNDIVKVSADGKVTAQGNTNGRTVVTAKTADGHRMNCQVFVYNRVPESVAIVNAPGSIPVGQSVQLEGQIKYSKATEKCGLTWTSSDENIATISSEGLLETKATGTVTITVKTENDKTASCTIKVTASEMFLEKTEIILKKGETTKLVPILDPAGAQDTFTYSSSNTDMVTVSNDGVVKTTSYSWAIGTAVITVRSSSGLEAKCTVHVPGMTLDSSNMTVNVGKSQQVAFRLVPDYMEQNITWTSSDDSVATVDEAGVVTGVSQGIVTIKGVSEYDVSISCVVTVTNRANEISLDRTSITLEAGMTEPIGVMLNPADAEDPLSYTSSNTRVVTVSDTGILTGKSAGSAQITVKTWSGLSAVCSVVVTSASVPATDITLNTTELELIPEQSFVLSATVSPSNATNKVVTWSSSDESVATVNQGGTVTAVGAGKATIKAELSNGVYRVCEVKVKAFSSTVVVIENEHGQQGETVRVPFVVKENTGLASMRLKIDYDKSVLTPVSVTAGELLSGAQLVGNLDEDGSYYVLWSQAENVTKNGILFYVDFVISEDAEHDISASIMAGFEEGDICDAEHNDIDLTIAGGEVTVRRMILGDVYRDNELNSHDILHLQQYMTELVSLDSLQLARADVNSDESITMQDVVLLARMLVNPSEFMRMAVTTLSLGEPLEFVIDLGEVELNAEGYADIPVSFSNCPGISAFKFKITYNAEEIELVSVNAVDEQLAGNLMSNLEKASEGEAIVTWYSNEDVIFENEVMNLRFVAKEDALQEDSVISMSIADGNLCNAACMPVAVKLEDGEVKPMQQPSITVSFDTQGGNVIESIKDIEGGNTITLPEDPVKDGYVFAGWFTEPEAKGIYFDENTPVIESITLYAAWEKILVYTVTLDEQGGAEVDDIVNVLPNTLVDLPQIEGPEGMNFAGWYTEPNGQGDAYYEQISVTGDLTLYAFWTPNPVFEGYIVEEIPEEDRIYSGTAIKPTPTVYDNNKPLVLGTDYTLSYKNNTKVGTAQVIIKGKGNYTKTMTIEFEIIPKSLNDENILITCADKVYNGKKQVSAPTVKWDKKTLKSGTDYIVTYSDDQISPGEVIVTIEGKGNYSGTAQTSYRITGKDISKALMDKIATQYYTGEEIEPEIILYADKSAKAAGEKLVLDTDYSLVYENNVNAGKGTVTIIGLGEYGGSKKVTFTISKRNITSYELDVTEVTTGNAIAEYDAIYNGSAQKPGIIITDNGMILEEGKDYKLAYANTANAATVDSKTKPTITITGLGNYTGSKKVFFNILPEDISTADGLNIKVDDAKYTGKAVKPKVTVTYAGKTLKSGTDYKVTYVNNIERGEDTAYVTIEGLKNFTGRVNANFRIYGQVVSGFVVDKIPTQIYTPHGAIEPEVFVYASKAMQKEGNRLTEGVDYEITSYEANEKAGTGKVIITGLGEYGGSKTVTFSISKRNLLTEGIFVEVIDQQMPYTGSALKPAFKVWDGDVELIEGVDYTVSYSNNKTVPKNVKTEPMITIKGKGNYTGTNKAAFGILPKSLAAEGIVITAKDVLFNQKTANSVKGMTTTVTVMDGGKKLSTANYKIVEYKDNHAAGTATVVITGSGNYSGTEEVTFRIYQNDISKVTVAKIPSELYTGKAIEPNPVVTFKLSKTETITLVEGEDYTITYDKNVKIGTAKVIINGMGEYGGSKSVTFTILPKWLKWFV